MGILRLKYGSQYVEISLSSKVVKLEFSEPEFQVSKDAFFIDLKKLLPKRSQSYREVAIVVSDKTRLCGYPEYLPWLVEILEHMGADKKNICFYIAYGTHKKQTEEESLCSYGETYSKFRFVHHDCSDDSIFNSLGTTTRGTPVIYRKDILKSTLLITFGSISHHYFAGYGGGRKLLFPGLSSKRAVFKNHELFLDKRMRSLAPGCQPGKLINNPLAEDLLEIENFAPSKISIYGILNASGKVCRLITGNSYDDFLHACHIHDGYYRCGSSEQYDLVIASGGGYPKDINFIQSHKAIHNAAAFVKTGGRLIILAECKDKIGSDFFIKYLEAGSFEAAFNILEEKYEGNGGTALSMMLKTRRIHIFMITSLNESQCKTIGVKKINEIEINEMINTEKGRIGVISNASMLIHNNPSLVYE